MNARPPLLAYIGVGSNLQDPQRQVERSVALLDGEGLRVLRRAALYGSSPMGPADQPDFVNTVLEVETALDPLDLLARCQAVELRMGRVETRRWGERVIDLDLLLYGALQLDGPELRLPHPGAHLRSFVLQPLAELAPTLTLGGRAVSALARDQLEPRIWRLEAGPVSRAALGL